MADAASGRRAVHMSVFSEWAQTRRGPVAQAFILTLAGFLFLVLLPGLFVVACPRLDRWLGLSVVSSGPVWLAVGAVLFVPGAVLALSSVATQLTRGRGTPVPMLPTQTLLTVGPYRYTRNPMTLGTVLAYLGIAVGAASVTGVVLVLGLGGLLVVYLKRVEEGELAERFGEEYVRYRATVPFMFPRVRQHH